jgi:hypothetical protein
VKRIVLYPFLFVLYAVLNPLVYNLDQIDPQQALRPLIVLLLVSAFGMAALWFWLKDWSYAGYLTFLGLVFILAFGHIQRLVQTWMPSPGSQDLTGSARSRGALQPGRPVVYGASRQWITPAPNLILAPSPVLSIIQALGADRTQKREMKINRLGRYPHTDCSEQPISTTSS